MAINNLTKILLVCGVIMLLIAMWANVNLYMSLASNPVDKATWATLGLVFDVVKITSLIVCGVLWTIFHRPFAALLAALAWLLLTGLSLSTLFGYTSKVTQETERHAAINSMGFKSAQAALESSEAKLNGLANFATPDAGLQARYDALVAKRQAIQTDYITKCIKPARARLDAIANELAPLQQKMDGYQAYQGAMASKNAALNESKAALAGGASVETLHPMFVNGATLLRDVFGVEATPPQLKVWFLALSATLCELLASFVLFLTAVMGGRDLHKVELDGVTSSSPAPEPAPEKLESPAVSKKVVGQDYPCEICGDDYTAKTVWQKHCPTCGAERRRQVKLAKAGKAAAMA
jgi:hypothetical protein